MFSTIKGNVFWFDSLPYRFLGSCWNKVLAQEGVAVILNGPRPLRPAGSCAQRRWIHHPVAPEMGSPAGERNDQSVLAVKAGETDEERKRSEWDDFRFLYPPPPTISFPVHRRRSRRKRGKQQSFAVPGRSSLSTHEFISSHQWCCA